MSKVIAKQIDNILRGDKFIRHKKNAKGNTAIYSRNHPTAKFVRVVVDSGIDLTSGKASSRNQVGVKARLHKSPTKVGARSPQKSSRRKGPRVGHQTSRGSRKVCKDLQVLQGQEV